MPRSDARWAKAAKTPAAAARLMAQHGLAPKPLPTHARLPHSSSCGFLSTPDLLAGRDPCSALLRANAAAEARSCAAQTACRELSLSHSRWKPAVGFTPSGTLGRCVRHCQVVAAACLLPQPPLFPVRLSLALDFELFGGTPLPVAEE